MTRLSLSKNKIRFLLLEGVHDTAIEHLTNAGYTNVERLSKALSGAELANAIRGVHVLGIRSRTEVTEEVLTAADRLVAVGCFCIGTNQVDLAATKKRGIPVFNAPYSNTRSVAELVMGEIVMLLRGIFTKSEAAHRGDWIKSAANSWEVRGKTLGIVGYGNIGSQLSVLAEAFGMRVLFYDVIDKLPHGNARPVASLDRLLTESDVVSLHVPETRETEGMFGEEQIRTMRPGSFLINASRGSVADLSALATALQDGYLLGAAVDVYPVEPSGAGDRLETPLRDLPNVILTPHIGGSTAEAQERIGIEVARKLTDYSDTGATLGAVNFPQVQLPPRPLGIRFMHVHRNVPGILGRVIEVFSRRSVNIGAQYLQTDGEIGYVVVDADDGADENREILEELRQLDGTIRARLLHERR